MGFSRSIGSLVVRIAADGIGAYKSDLNAAADATNQAAGKMETSANRAVNAAKNMGGGLGQAAQGAEVVMAAAGGAGLAVGVLAAGFGLAGAAAYQGAKEKQAYAKSLILTGNAAGVTTGQLADMAKGISSSVGTTGQAAAALAAMAGSGAVAGGSLQKFSQVAIEMERTVGQKVADTVSQFAELGNAPVAASLKLNQSMNYLTASTFAQIKAAQELGDMESAASIAQNAYANAAKQRIDAVEKSLGIVEKAWRGAGAAAGWAWDKMMNLGRQDGAEQVLEKAKAGLAKLEKLDMERRAGAGLGSLGGELPGKIATAKEMVALAQENVKLSQRSATLQAEKAATEKAGIAGITAVTAANTKALDKQEQMNKALEDYSTALKNIKAADPTSKLLKPELIAKTEAAIRAQFADKGGRGGGGAAAAFNDEANAKIEALKRAQGLEELLAKQSVDRVTSEHRRGMVTDIDFINQVAATETRAMSGSITAFEAEKVIAAGKKNSKKEIAAIDGMIAAAKEKINGRELQQGYAVLELEAKIAAARQAFYNTADHANIAQLDGLRDKNTASQLELEAIGLTKELMDKLTLSRQNDAIATQAQKVATMQFFDASGQSSEAIQIEIDKLNELKRAKGLTADIQAKTALVEEEKKAKQEQIDLWKQIDSTAESVFMDIAKNGTSAFKHLEDELKNGLLKLLYEMTVKKWIISIGSDLTGLDLGSLMGGSSGGLGNSLVSKGLDFAGTMLGGGGSYTSSAIIGSGAVSGVSTTSLAGIELASQGLTTLAPAITTIGTVATTAAPAVIGAGASLTGMATAALAAIPVIGWVALGIGALFAIFGSGKDKIPTVLNDLALFNNSLVGLPFLELAIGSDDAAQGLRDVLYGLENATPTMRKLAGETIQLSVELMRASGDIAGARNLARNLGTRGMNEEEIAVFDYNEKLRDQIEAQHAASAAASAGAAAAQAAEQAENTLAQTRWNIAGKLNVLLGRTTQMEFDRATALAATSDEASLGMLRLTYTLEDLHSAVDKNFAALERSVAAEKKLADVRLKSATDLATALKTTKDAISPSLDRASAQSQIAMYVALAKAGGVLPTAAALKPALDSIAKPSESLFRTFEDYALDQAHTANDISDLAGFADAQVSEAQQAIERLDLQLETAKNQLDVLKGVDNSVLSVAEAVRNFEASMLAVATAQASAGNYSFAAPAASSSYSGGGGGGYSGGGASSASSATAGMDSDIVAAFQAYYGRAPDKSGYDNFLKSGLTGDAMMQAILHASIADKTGADYNYALAHGFDPENPLSNFYHGKDKYKATSAPIEYFANGGDFGGGLRMVGERGPELEATGPSRITNTESLMSLFKSGGNNDALVAEIRALRAEVAGLRTAADKTAANTGKTADTLQGQQGVPFLVEIAK